MIAYIPSPSTNALHLGPFTFHAYGFFIALGVIAAIVISNKRWTARGGTSDDISALAMWGVPCGIVGARAYHVVTDFELYSANLLKIFYVWDGGLGIWGGIAGGVAGGLFVARQRKLAVAPLLDAVAPGLALAQAIGRWGNYFNQELFGGPTTLPWGLRINVLLRPTGYESFATFHPAFLYESIWDVTVACALIAVDRCKRLRHGNLFALYIAGYTFGRFFIERLRIDHANSILGLRVNEWTSIVLFVVAVTVLIMRQRTAMSADDNGVHEDDVNAAMSN